VSTARSHLYIQYPTMIRVCFPARIPVEHERRIRKFWLPGLSRRPLYVERFLDRVKYLLHCVAINDVLPPREGETYPPSSDYATKNYPPPGDSTYFLCNVVADVKITSPFFPQRRRRVVDGPAPYLIRTAGTLTLICPDSSSARRHKGVTRPRRAWTRARKQPRRSRLVTAHHASGCTRVTVVVSILSAHEPFSVLGNLGYWTAQYDGYCIIQLS